MVIQTARFGEIDIDPEGIINIEEGLLGFPEENRFCLLETKPGSPFRWFQAVDRGELAFLVINPYDFFSDYEIFLEDEVAEEMMLAKPEDAAVLALVSIQDAESLTANLVGPVVVNTRTGKGMQVVLDGERYSTRHLIASQEQDAAASPAA